jgi:hypothetical protein
VLKPLARMRSFHLQIDGMFDLFPSWLLLILGCKIEQSSHVIGVPQLLDGDSFTLVDLQTSEYDLF